MVMEIFGMGGGLKPGLFVQRLFRAGITYITHSYGFPNTNVYRCPALLSGLFLGILNTMDLLLVVAPNFFLYIYNFVFFILYKGVQ